MFFENSVTNDYKLSIFFLSQIIVFLYTIFVAPFESKLDCVVETTNDSFYLAIIFILMINDKVATYTNSLSITILSLVILNGIVVFAQVNSVIIFNLCK